MKTLITHLNESVKPIFKGTIKSHYTAVDLGLSVKWCDCNVGAEKPEDPGLLFQWGRADGYKYGDENNKFLPEKEYVPTSGTDYEPNDTIKPEDDIAHVNMKGKWRMPTKEEMDELVKLEHKLTELNGVKGYEITGKNGNSIFIPVTGYYHGTLGKFYALNSLWGYWGSTIRQNFSYHKAALVFDENRLSESTYYDCDQGYAVRGVCE